MDRTRKPKVGLSLSGGAAFGMAHIGVLRYFEEQKIPIDAIVGTSAGAIIGALYTFGIPIEQIDREAHKLSWRLISNVAPSQLGFISNKSLGELIIQLIGEQNIEDAHIPLAISATDIRTGELVVFRSGSVTDAVRASAAIPGIYLPVTIGEHMLVDGGLCNNMPCVPLVDMKMDVLIGVDVIAHSERYTDPTSYADILANTYTIFTHGVNNHSRKPFDVLIDPNIDSTIMDLSKVEKVITAGYEAAREAHGRIEDAIAAKEKKRRSWWERIYSRVAKFLVLSS